MQTASIVHPGTRFLALSAIALITFAAPVRADDWATVRADGSVTRGNTPNAQSTTLPPRDETYDGQNADNARGVRTSKKSDDANAQDEVRHLRSGNDRNNHRRERNGNRGGYNPAPNNNPYPYNNGYAYGAPNYGTQTYGYGAPAYGYYPPVNQTIVVPPVIYSGPIGGPPAFPWVKQPWITSVPVGPTVYSSPGYGYAAPGYPAPYPTHGYTVPGYPAYGYPQQGVPYGVYPQGQTYTNGVHGSVTFGGGGTRVTVGGHRQTTSSYYNGYNGHVNGYSGYSRRR